MTTRQLDWQQRAKRLASELAEAGHLHDPAWRAAFEQTPRHALIPSFYQAEATTPGRLIIGEESDDPELWLDSVYRDDALLTQQRHLGPDADTRLPTSSSSQPSTMAVMLDRMRVPDGGAVLEIGTGAGYNAALLCHRLGDENVTSVDIDPELVAEARQRLGAIGRRPTLIAADGAEGASAGAPFDAIIATCAVSHIPPAWVSQLKPGGRIVAPFGEIGGALAVLTKTEPQVAVGAFDPFPAYFMPLRATADDPRGPLGFYGIPSVDPPVPYESVTDINPRDMLDPEFRLWLELHISPIALIEPGEGQDAAVLACSDDSYAAVSTQPQPDGAHLVRQFGRRRPWDTVEAAWRSWNRHGRPGRTRLGIWAPTTVSEQYVWLDSPTSDICWPMPV